LFIWAVHAVFLALQFSNIVVPIGHYRIQFVGLTHPLWSISIAVIALPVLLWIKRAATTRLRLLQSN
jgi:hypothetical protein